MSRGVPRGPSPTPSDTSPGVSGRWPDLLLVGAAHAGTARLQATLARHPGIGFSDPVEPHFFAGIQPSRRFARQVPVVSHPEAYRSLFATIPASMVAAEASTSSLWSTEAPGRIHAANPDARIVILLRDPVERAWAHHRADRAAGAERRGFLRAIRDELARPGRWGQDQVVLGAGFYADALGRYLDRFGRGRVWVGFHESLDPHAQAAASEIVDWLGLDVGLLPPMVVAGSRAPHSGTRGRGSWLDALRGRSPVSQAAEPVMDETIRRLLEEVYAPDVARVSELLGVVPPWSITPPM